MKNAKPITAWGEQFASVAALARDKRTDVSDSQLRVRLGQGWPPELAAKRLDKRVWRKLMQLRLRPGDTFEVINKPGLAFVLERRALGEFITKQRSQAGHTITFHQHCIGRRISSHD